MIRNWKKKKEKEERSQVLIYLSCYYSTEEPYLHGICCTGQAEGTPSLAEGQTSHVLIYTSTLSYSTTKTQSIAPARMK